MAFDKHMNLLMQTKTEGRSVLQGSWWLSTST